MNFSILSPLNKNNKTKDLKRLFLLENTMKKRRNYLGMTAFIEGSFRLLEDEERCYKMIRRAGYCAVAQIVFLPAPFVEPDRLPGTQGQGIIIEDGRSDESYESDGNLRRAA